MKNPIFLFVILFLLVVLTGCSTVNTTNNQTPDNVYVFDDATDLNEEIEEEPVEEVEPAVANEGKTIYIVQVGAFTTKNRAETFKRKNISKVNYEMSISYSSNVGLFVVQLPEFESRQEAERVRNMLWKDKSFNDAFILIRKK